MVILSSKTGYDDQDWVVAKDASGYWTIKNAKSGRYFLDTDATNNNVIWNTGAVIDDSLWGIEQASTGGLRIKNKYAGRSYMYGTSANELKWNTGATDTTTVWSFEQN
ncbi:hypothetical protein D3C75_916110 [compost metagenome]